MASKQKTKKMKRMRGGGMTSTSTSKGPGGGMMGGSGSGGPSRTAPSKASSSSPASSKSTSKASTSGSGNKSGVGGGGGGGGGASGSRGSSVGAPVSRSSGTQAKGNAPSGNKTVVGGGGGGGGGATGSRGSSTVKPAPIEAGKRLGPMSPDVQDMRKWQGPPDRQTAVEKTMIDYGQRMSEMSRLQDQRDLSEVSGYLSPTGAHYGPTRAQLGREIDTMRQNMANAMSLRDKNADRRRTPDPSAAPFRQEVSGMLPASRLPSQVSRSTSGPVNRLSGNQAFQNRMAAESVKNRTGVKTSGPRTRGEEGPMFKRGGVVRRKKTGK